jgi:hypothetical protein
MIVQWYEDQNNKSSNVQLPDVGGYMLTINIMLAIDVDPGGYQRESGEVRPTPGIGIQEETALDNPFASNETIETFALQILKRGTLLGVSI